MARYHISPSTGSPGRCTARPGFCPYGALTEHYGSAEEARGAYELSQSAFGEGALPGVLTHTMELSPACEELLSTMEAEGFVPYVVGGAVRDSVITGAPPKDVDVEVFEAANMDVLATVLRKHYQVDEVGKAFGVLKLQLPDGTDIDVSLPRRDSMAEGGSKHTDIVVEVAPELTMEEAAGRRDFTINALYYSHSKGALYDPYNGLADWEKRELRHTSEAFGEDPLRVLRAVQFASRFELTLAPETAELARSMSDTYSALPKERLQEEWAKLFTKSNSVEPGLTALGQTGWDRHFGLDTVSTTEASVVTDLTLRGAQARGLDKAFFGSAALALQLPPEKRKDFLKSTLVGDKAQLRAQRLITAPGPSDTSPREVNRWARKLGKESLTVQQWAVLHGAHMPPPLVKKLEDTARSSGSLTGPLPDILQGRDVLAESDRQPGPWMGALLKKAAQAQDDEVFRDEVEARTWLRKELASL